MLEIIDVNNTRYKYIEIPSRLEFHGTFNDENVEKWYSGIEIDKYVERWFKKE